MEEKKLTDEEIVVNILSECFATGGNGDCRKCKLFTGNGLESCMKNVSTLTLDLIHRLQDENKQLKGFVSGLEDEKKVESIIFGLKETIAEQKAEIERLAKVEIDLIGKIADKSAEIERLKDENIEERDIHFKNLCGYKDEIARLQKQVKKYQDAIVQGEMIELPCKVGTIVYYVGSYQMGVWKKKIRYDIFEFPFTLEMLDSYGNNWFLTREEAEKRLKELQE